MHFAYLLMSKDMFSLEHFCDFNNYNYAAFHLVLNLNYKRRSYNYNEMLFN